MDTNHEERTLRVIPMGLRNYLLVGRSLVPPVLAGFRACLLPASYMESIRIPIWSTFYSVFRLIRYGMCRSLHRGSGRSILRQTRCHPHLSWRDDKNQRRRLKIKSCLLLRQGRSPVNAYVGWDCCLESNPVPMPIPMPTMP